MSSLGIPQPLGAFPVAPAAFPAGRRSAAPTARPPKHRRSFEVKLLYLLWFFVLCDPQWLASETLHFRPIRQLPTLLFLWLLILLITKAPKGDRLPPMLAILIYTLVMLPFSYNLTYALVPTKQMIAYYVLASCTLAWARHPKDALPIILGMGVYQYIWWAQGAPTGLIWWHPSNSNYDGFGPLMVLGMTSCFYSAMAFKQKRWLKRLCWVLAMVCLAGLMSSFARGAILSGAAVLAFGFWRAPRKGVVLGGLLIVGTLVGLMGTLFFSNVNRGRDSTGNFFSEMASITNTEDATRVDRDALWDAATKVYLRNPVFGVGAQCFGPWAAGNFRIGEIGGAYTENPLKLFDRQLHSTYYQIISERGTVGSILFIIMIVDFWRRNLKLRRKDYLAYWRATMGSGIELKWIALGLEAQMVGYLCTSVFYNQLEVPWLYTIVTVNALASVMAKPPAGAARAAARPALRPSRA